MTHSFPTRRSAELVDQQRHAGDDEDGHEDDQSFQRLHRAEPLTNREARLLVEAHVGERGSMAEGPSQEDAGGHAHRADGETARHEVTVPAEAAGDRKSKRLNSSHKSATRIPSSARKKKN